MTKTPKLMQGNEACVEGAIAAGMRFYAGYPITPSTEIAELSAEKLPKVGGKFIQMEDEIASMAAVVGASLTGLKAMTATSGPGFSLKQENIGFASIAEVPCVVVNVQRGGPSTGLPTNPAQGDVMQAKWGTHGDHPVIVISPSSVLEAYTLTVKAFNLAERFRVPVVFLMDEVIAHMRERVELPDAKDLEIINRQKPTVPPNQYFPYDADEKDGVPPMAAFGEGYHFHVTGLVHDKTGFPSGKPEVTDKLIRRLINKIELHKDEILMFETYNCENPDTVVISFGSSARSSRQAVNDAINEGLNVGFIKINTIWPFPDKIVKEVASKAKNIIVPEMNLGQLAMEVERIVAGKCPVYGVNRIDGELITPDEILAKIKGVN
jgi:2-oxoglutarate ferredoxin oxidoreductase subunit alpha